MGVNHPKSISLFNPTYHRVVPLCDIIFIYQKAGFFDANVEAHLFLSELLIKLGGEANQAEAKKYLEKAAQSADSYYKNGATRLLAEIEK